MLNRATEALIALGITQDAHPDLFEAAIKYKTAFATNFPAAFTALEDEGLTPDKHPDLFRAAIQYAGFADYFPAALAALKKMDLTPDQHPDLFEAAIKDKMAFATNFPAAFTALKDEGLTPDQHPDLFRAAIQYAGFSDCFPAALAALKKMGLTPDQHPDLFRAAIQYAGFADSFSDAFYILQQNGLSPDRHPSLFIAAIPHAMYTGYLRTLLTALINTGATPDQHPSLFLAALQHIEHTDAIAHNLATLRQTGATPDQHLGLFQQVCENQANVANTLSSLHSKLCAAGYKRPDHNLIFQAVLDDLASDSGTTYSALQLTNKACQLANTHRALLTATNEASQSALTSKLRALIETTNTPWDGLTHGPLTLSPATVDLHEFLQILSQTNIAKIDARYDQAVGFIIKLPGTSDIPLNLLLRNANLSQLRLSPDLIQKIGNRLHVLLGNQWRNASCSNQLISNLYSTDQQKAFAIYFTQKYNNINRLFRGEALTAEDKYCLFTCSNTAEANDVRNIFTCFLLGCLINDATNKLNTLAWNTKEADILIKIAAWWLNPQTQKPRHLRQFADLSHFIKDEAQFNALLEASRAAQIITDNEYQLLTDKGLGFTTLKTLWTHYDEVCRYENISPDVRKQRTANPWTLPALTSVSVFSKGSPYFQEPGSTQTTLHHLPCHLVVNEGEGEVLLPQGLQVVSVIADDAKLHSYIVNSPDLEKNHYWSEVALLHAYENHLSKDYQDQSAKRMIDETEIARPNHGLAHTYRVMAYLDVVIRYFAIHAEDEKFKLFCQTISDSDREWLKIAAAFSITGRESEISAGENLQRYDEFRAASEQHFNSFAADIPVGDEKKRTAMRERLAHVVRYMGNPSYEAATDTQSARNTHADPDERKMRNQLHRLLTIAHKLDLPRCYHAEQFEGSMQHCRDLSAKSEQQQSDYYDMIRYAIALNKAHGNALQFGLTANNEYTHTGHQSYQPQFAKASTSMQQLRELSATVTVPTFQAAAPDTALLTEKSGPAPCEASQASRAPR